MQSIITIGAINEGDAGELILNACTRNRIRTSRGDVSFSPLANGNFQAILRDDEGYVIALAEVDALDN